MFSTIRKAKAVVPFFYERLSDYAQIAQVDLARFRNETVRSIAGAMIGVAAILLLLSFIGLAVIVTAWDTRHRVLTAWLVALGWGVGAAAAVYLARRLIRSSPPFAHVGTAISRDLAAVKNPTWSKASHDSKDSVSQSARQSVAPAARRQTPR